MSKFTEWDGLSFFNSGTNSSCGVAVLFNPTFNFKLLDTKRDYDGRILSLKFSFQNQIFNIVNIYAPNIPTCRKTFFANLHTFIFSGAQLCIAGDYNCVVNNLDKQGGNINNGFEGKDEIFTLMKDFHLVDFWRLKNPGARMYSWYSSDLSVACRLDRFLISKTSISLARSCEYSVCPLSDHDCVTLKFSLFSLRHKSLWKFDNAILKDASFREQLNELLSIWENRVNWYENINLWWDALKLDIKKLSKRYCHLKQKAFLADKTKLTKEYLKLRRKALLGLDWAKKHAKTLYDKLCKLDRLESEKIKKYSRAQWIEEGEKPTRYFCNLLHRRADDNLLTTLYNEQMIEVSTHEDLKSTLVSFYSKLFTKEPTDSAIQDDLLRNVSKRVTRDQTALDQEITIEDLTNALNSLPNYKTPGSDGLTVEFYSHFWEFLGPKLVQVLNFSFYFGLLPDSQRECIIRLIHKRDDKRDLKNWRPISLLNVDYKLCAKVLSQRLQLFLDQIVHDNQSCSVPGRKITSNLILIRDMLDYISTKNCPAILVNIDQEKAFDRVDWDFLFRLLHHYGFGDNFIRWVRLLYTNISSCIICNGDLTIPFRPTRGVRQGCSLSPLLYILVAEVLGCNIRACNNVEGFRIPGGSPFKLTQYADDTTCFVHDLFSLQKLLDLTDKYGRGTGAKLNVSKTEAMWLGSHTGRVDKPLGLKWVTTMKVLGVYFGDNAVNANWDKRVTAFKKVTDLWLRRNLTVKGRVVIANTFGLSKFYYIAKILIPPSSILDKIRKILVNFVWHGKAHLVSQDVCRLPFKQGGLRPVSNVELFMCRI